MKKSETFEALRFHKIGGPEVLEFNEIEFVPPKGKEVVFKVEAFALNQADILFINGYHYTVPEFPSRIGSEAVGQVVAVGEQVKNFRVGDRVTSIPFYTQKYLVQGEYATSLEEYLAEVPANLNLAQATSFWMQFLTGYFALFEVGKLKKGDVALIAAASSSAGQGAIQLAKEVGATVVATTRSEAKREILLQLGADIVLVGDSHEIGQKLIEAQVTGINLIFDPIAGSFCNQYLPHLAYGASIIIYGLLSGEETLFPILELVRNKAQIFGYSMFNHVNNLEDLERAKKYILERINSGDLVPLVDKEFEFKDAVKAYKYMLSNQQMGKIVVKINS